MYSYYVYHKNTIKKAYLKLFTYLSIKLLYRRRDARLIDIIIRKLPGAYTAQIYRSMRNCLHFVVHYDLNSQRNTEHCM